METAEAVFVGVAAQAEQIANDAEQVYEIVDVGDEIRQGDIYITRLKAKPKGVSVMKVQASQLAPGTTQGSRHCLRSMEGVRLYQVENAGPLDGPVIVAKSGFAIDHPEHGNIVLPAGIYAITFQRAFAEELRRVQD